MDPTSNLLDNDFLDNACRMKLLLSFNKEVQEMEEYQFISPARTFIKRICAYIRKEDNDTNGCSGITTSYEEGEKPIFARDIIKNLLIEKMLEIVNSDDGETLSQYLLNYDKNNEIEAKNKYENESVSSNDSDLTTGTFDNTDTNSVSDEQLIRFLENDNSSSDGSVTNNKNNVSDEQLIKFLEKKEGGGADGDDEYDEKYDEYAKTIGLGQFAGRTEETEDDDDLQGPPKSKTATSSEPEDIVNYLTDYMGDYVKCNKYAHEETKLLLHLVFKTALEEFSSDDSFALVFEKQAKRMTIQVIDDKIKIYEDQLKMMIDMIDKSSDLMGKVQITQKYFLLLNELYLLYKQKQNANDEEVDLEDVFIGLLKQLPTYENDVVKKIFNGEKIQYKTISRTDQLRFDSEESEEESQETEEKEKIDAAGDGPPLPESNSDDENSDSEEPSIDTVNLQVRYVPLTKFNSNNTKKGDFLLNSELFGILDKHINPKDESPPEEEKEEEEEDIRQVTTTSALFGGPIQEDQQLDGGKKKKEKKRKYTKRKRPRVKSNRTR